MTEQKLEPDHEFIYLQLKETSQDEGRLWCQDNINGDDTKYVRADIAASREAELQEELKIIRQYLLYANKLIAISFRG